jgi:uncharacterized protein YbaR (Trm112 family)
MSDREAGPDKAKQPAEAESASERTPSRTVDPKLLDMLACPLTKAPLRWVPERAELVSSAARLAYPVRDGVPIMLPSEARHLADGEADT